MTKQERLNQVAALLEDLFSVFMPSIFATHPTPAQQNAIDRVVAALMLLQEPSIPSLLQEARDYLSGIPESAAGGDDQAVDLTRRLTKALEALN